jgi:branched-chain amino acid transport system substrate-binding protein
MKKYYATVIVIVIVIVGWIVFKNNSKTKDTGSQNTTSSVVKVGVIAPLTGPLAEYGEAFKNGITLAQEKTGNKNVQFIFEDSAYDPKQTVSALYKLRDTDKVNILFNWGDPTSQALAPLMKDQVLPFIAFTSVAPVTQTSQYTVRPWNRPEDFAQAMWQYLRSKHLKNIGIVKVENLYLNSLMDALVKAKNTDEKVTLIDNYLSFGDKDFRTSISKIKNVSSKYDALGVYLASGQIGQFYRQAQQLGLNIPTFGTDFFENQSDIDTASTSINGAVYANYDVSPEFKTMYQAKFGNVSQIAYAGNAYDVVMMMNNMDLSSKDSIITSFKQIKGFAGVLGSYTYMESAADRYLSSPVHIKLINDGKIQAIN